MVKKSKKDLISRLADAGEEAVNRLSDAPGMDRVTKLANSTRDRVDELTKRDLMFTLPKTYRGKHLPHPKAELLRGRVVSVDSAMSPLPVELDGEQPGTTPVRIEIVPRALRLRVPA